ncbi:MAG: diguanylate cyclase [Defluviitaleaceae bacterium]|nr:diguanylate cyclase [Defluviitaleaceae bacterium]
MSGADAKKKTVLVVDDSDTGRAHLIQILNHEYIVRSASGGVEALQIAKSERPDIILLDVVMPQLDGYGVLTALREMGETKDIPVIFITSLDQSQDEEKGLKLGAEDYISKPYNPTIVKLRVSLQLKIIDQMRQIEELGMIDSVSKLPNRRYFDKRLREEWQRAEAEGRRLGVLMIGVDKLRTLIAIHGYSFGDRCTEAIGGILKGLKFRSPGDFAASWAFGGFAIMLLNADEGICEQVGEAVRVAIEAVETQVTAGGVVDVTVSIGANSALPSAEGSVDKLIAGADSALYLARELGRNKVVVNKS